MFSRQRKLLTNNGELKILIVAAENMSPDTMNVFKTISFLARTVTQRDADIGNSISSQFKTPRPVILGAFPWLLMSEQLFPALPSHICLRNQRRI